MNESRARGCIAPGLIDVPVVDLMPGMLIVDYCLHCGRRHGSLVVKEPDLGNKIAILKRGETLAALIARKNSVLVKATPHDIVLHRMGVVAVEEDSAETCFERDEQLPLV